MNFAQWKESLSDEQKDAFNLHVRQLRNKSADQKQYNKYVQRLGIENMPKDFKAFQDFKYIKVDEWEELKGFYSYKYDNKLSTLNDYRCAKELTDMGIKGSIHIPAKSIDTSKLIFDDIHINAVRKHNVSEKEAKEYINNALMSITKRKGLSENYYSKQGVAYVNPIEEEIKTAFSKREFGKDVTQIMEVLEKYGY